MHVFEELSKAITGTIITDPEKMDQHLGDASAAVPGRPAAVIEVTSRADVTATLAWASKYQVPITARGAGTGVSGAATAIDNSIVVSFAKMNRILDLRPADGLAVVEPGVVIDDLNDKARELGMFFAPDPASSASATIGGAIATNAGGLRCIKYGVTADSVRSLEVVLSDGRVITTGTESRKNVAGLDLTRLVVGSEGTLGLVTQATVELRPVPVGTNRSFSAAFATLADAGRAVSAIVSSPTELDVLEMMNRTATVMVEEYSPCGLNTSAGATLIGEIIDIDAPEKLEAVRTICIAHGAVHFETSDSDDLLRSRRLLKPAMSNRGMGVEWNASDAGVPISQLGPLLEYIEEVQTVNGRRISVAAHAGDGNIHAAVESLQDDVHDHHDALNIVELIASKAVALGGTVTGEHGIGSLKLDLLSIQFAPNELELFSRIKEVFDPLNLLNPGRSISAGRTPHSPQITNGTDQR